MLYNIERPHTFDSMVGQREIVKNIRNQSIKDKFFQVYILEGQFGSGKTTMARIIALASNCKHKDENGNPCLECPDCKAILKGTCTDIMELDAASNTGVDAIRDLKETVNYMPIQLGKKVYIIDEVHMLSNGAFNALLKVLEEPPEHVIFILCTTESKKIPATVRSRAARYLFQSISEADIVGHLLKVCNKHSIHAEETALRVIARNSHGAMRDALSLLEQVSKMADCVTEQHVIDMLGITDPTYLCAILEEMITTNVGYVIASIETLISKGKEPFQMVSDMLDILSSCVVASYRGAEVTGNTQQECDLIRTLIELGNPSIFCSLIDGLMTIREELRNVPDHTTIVCGIIRMFSEEKGAATVLSERIQALETEIEKLKKGGLVSIPPKNTSEKMENKETIEVEQHVQEPCDTPEHEDTEIATEEEETETEIEEKEQQVIESPQMNNIEEEEDPMNWFSMDLVEHTPEQPNKKEERTFLDADENGRSYFSPEDVDAYLEDLYDSQKTLESVFELNCTRTVEDSHVIFTTVHENIYQLITEFDKVYDFPFEFRLAS